ncbi:epoxide hydrolase family protein [Rhizobium sp. Root1220]|uniref:epoxide hydrolase family protein n=1 Tax=Rhizobium sp. Root1220 TaxID=1736432 RepID=UPI0006FC8B40|nr:epoxide hydrolase family protein [Rhizobium sp. Root1220]KQV83169.1 multidrug MFS transporter [Rhizobium sp. Root1220]
MESRPFQIHIDDEALNDLHRRLQQTKWPDSIDPDGWGDGSSLTFMRDLIEYWRDAFDWRAQEARLNELPHFIAKVDGLDIHYIHVKGRGPSPTPLIMTHGWPGSFLEMEDIIPLLTDPRANGGDSNDAFDIVVPSLPGYTFSSAPRSPGTSPYEIAGLWQKLMTGLGYESFVAQGGDIGAAVSSWLAFRFPDRVTGFHLNYIPGGFSPPLESGPPMAAEETAYKKVAAEWADNEGAYAHMHGTKPQTLAYGLSDSPVGLAAWIVEKFRSWSDCDGDILKVFSMDTLLTEISLYWFSGSLESSFRLYKESKARPLAFTEGQRILPPVGVSHFAKELPQPPRSWVGRVCNVVQWTEHATGGHFAAMEKPKELVEDMRIHFRALRSPSL